MQLDERSTMLLKALLLSPGIKVKELSNNLNLSRSQVNYRLEKINDWLTDNHYPVVQNDRELGIIVDQSVRERFPELLTCRSVTDYIPSVRERVYFILIMLLSREEDLSLFHISSTLKVSRNTILTDLKKAEHFIKPYKTTIIYTRENGYFIHGDEFNKRKLLVELVPKILKITNGFRWLLNLTNISTNEVLQLKQRCENVEEKLHTKFTDEKLDELPITFLLLSRRIRYGKKISFNHKKINDLTNTKEYKVVQELLPTIKEIDKDERLFVTLQILASSVFTLPLTKTEDEILRNAINQMLYRFENLACVSFQNSNELSEKIYQHMKPASYRIKFGIDIENPLIEEVKRDYGSIHHLVKQSVAPIELLFEEELPDDEIGFITILIISWLQGQGSEIRIHPKAIVICPNGISVSKLLLETLKYMFPDIHFVENMSVREFYKYNGKLDLVFSTVVLDTDKKLFLVKPFISEAEKRNLQTRVNQEVFGIDPFSINYSGLINVIKKHAPIENEELLMREIKKFLGDRKIIGEKSTKDLPDLGDILTLDRITLKTQVTNLEEAIQIAAMPLLEANTIESSYIHSILKIIGENEPYMFIAPGVAIPHARPEDGVNRLSMSMLRLKHSLEMAPGFAVKLIIIIAAIDRKTHLKALSQLNELVSTKENIKRLEEAETKQHIVDLIQNYSQNNTVKEVIEK